MRRYARQARSSSGSSQGTGDFVDMESSYHLRFVSMSTKLLVLICSNRPGAQGHSIGQWLVDTITPRAVALGAEIVPVPIDLPFLDTEEAGDHARRWSETVAGADGFIAVTPEYNYGMPATLKNALDYLKR